MERKITEKLIAWKNQTRGRMPLLLYGARQVGKTYTIMDFGENHYKSTVYINLETNKTVRDYFADNIEPGRIIRFLETEARRRITPGETLIFFDEAQSCPRAITSLKYFNENEPAYHIICAGRLLGVAINREEFSFPVGNVDSMTMYPLDFEEFLWSIGEKMLCGDIKEAFETNTPLPLSLHERALDHYRAYLIVGGMPKPTLTYAESESLIIVPDIQAKIINDYIADMAKYATNTESVKIRAAYNSIPAQLAKDNKKFQYKLAQRGGTATIFGSAIDWLRFSGIVLKCGKLDHAFMPIKAYQDLANFKLYMGDVGLLTLNSGISLQTILSPGEIGNTFLGALSENYVAQAFAANQYGLFYWATNGQAEMDFVLQKGNDIIPIEVKTGIRVKSKSLNIFIAKYKPSYSIRISAKNFGCENGIKAVPLYAAFCI